jgi:glycosyltransferase involved in cell wall biosynthesis
MRIGFILDGDFKKDSRVINEARILESKGNSIFVLNPGKHGSPVYEAYWGSITIFRLPFSKRISNYLFAIENLIHLYDRFWSSGIKKLIKEHNLEAIHVHDLYLARAGRLAAKSFNIPVILDLHENYPAAIIEYQWATRFPSRLIVRPEKWQNKEKKYLSYADRIIVLSTNFKNSLTTKYPFLVPEHILIYPNVPDVSQLLSFSIKKNIFLKDNKFVLFYFGVISKRRGILTTIEALKILLPSHPSLHLLLIGPIDKAERESFEKLFSEKEVKDHITHYNWKDISDLPSYLECSDICLSPLIRNPQHDSGVANKIFQYMLFKRPILVSDCIPQKEIIEDAFCGRYFKNNDPTDMATVLEQMLAEPDELKNMGERGKSAVLTKYNTAIQGEAIIKAYMDHGKNL